MLESEKIIFNIIDDERQRQEDHLEMIASENYTSSAIMRAQGSVLTNKYAEGYPNKRYYGGCEHVDKIEQLAIDQACKLFECSYANVQPHSGSCANAAVYQAFLEPGDTIMGLSLEHGGHLTHGCPVNFSGKIYQSVPYQTNAQGWLDYDDLQRHVLAIKPKMIVAGFSAYSRQIQWSRLREIADQAQCWFLADMAHISGLVAAKAHPSPLPWADVVTSTTHKTLRGPRGGMILSNRDDLANRLNKAIFPGMQGGPLMHVVAGKALCYAHAQTEEFAQYIKNVIDNAKILSDSLIKHGFEIITGGTDTHLLLVSLLDKPYSGKDLEQYLESAGIICNKNAVPGDKRSPFVSSGIRLGTAALTSRSMGRDEMELIASWIAQLCEAWPCAEKAQSVKKQVKELCQRFPVPH